MAKQNITIPVNVQKTIIFSSLFFSIIGSIIGGLILLFIKTNFIPKIPEIFVSQPKPHQPQNIRITNLSDNNFSVSWITQKPVQKSNLTYYLKNAKPKTVKSQQVLLSRIHQIDIKNLAPQNTYYFTIFSEKETFLNDDNPFEVRTLKTPDKPPDPPFILTGTVLDRNGNPQPNALVFFGLTDNITPLSSWTNQKGSFLLSLNNARNKSDSNYFSPQPGQTGHLMVETGETSFTKKFNIEKNLNLTVSPNI